MCPEDIQENIATTVFAVEQANKADNQSLARAIALAAKADELKKAAANSLAAKSAAAKVAQAQAIKQLTSEEIKENLMAIPNLLETSDDEYEHACIYGDAGMGKTLAICLLSEFYHVLFFDADKGLKVAIRTLPTEMQSRIHAIRIPDNTMNPVFWNSILKIVTGRKVRLCTGHGIIDCPICLGNSAPLTFIELNRLPKNWIVGMDSITQFVSSAMATINRRAAGNKPDTVDEFKFTFDEWAVLRNITEKFGNYLKDLQCNFLAVSHTLLTKTEDEKTQKIVPIGGTENASRAFAKYFSTVVNCRIQNNKHIYATSSTYNSSITTKSRSNVKLELEKTPSLLHLFRADAAELLKGSWNEQFYSGIDPTKITTKVKGVLPE